MGNKKFYYSALFVALFLFPSLIQAQEQQEEREVILAPMDIFVPHWQVGGSIGVGYDVGEAKFEQLLSPALQLEGAYHFNEFLAVRLSLSGFQSKNRYAYPAQKYSWNYLQPAVELKADLASIFLGWKPDRKVTPYIFGGVGTAITFGNGDATDAVEKDPRFFQTEFQKLWESSRLHLMFRAGLGSEFWLNDKVALTLEANANMLPDHYNSKKGTHDNLDWRFNALVGVKFRLGKHVRKTDPVYGRTIEKPQPVIIRDTITNVVRDTVTIIQERNTPIRITPDMAKFTVNIQFLINRSNIRDSQIPKMNQLLLYLREHPDVHVLLTGYADKETGTPQINDRLSRERSASVAKWLQQHGISEYRIHSDSKGDRFQPFNFPEENRVCICIVLDATYF